MFRALPLIPKLSLLLAAMTLVGGQWGVLQLVAWTGMAVSYSTTYGVREGLTKTFDGSKPCSMCMKIKDGRSEEKQKQEAIPTKASKIEAIAEAQIHLERFSASKLTGWPDYLSRSNSRSERPLLQPPRNA